MALSLRSCTLCVIHPSVRAPNALVLALHLPRVSGISPKRMCFVRDPDVVLCACVAIQAALGFWRTCEHLLRSSDEQKRSREHRRLTLPSLAVVMSGASGLGRHVGVRKLHGDLNPRASFHGKCCAVLAGQATPKRHPVPIANTHGTATNRHRVCKTRLEWLAWWSLPSAQSTTSA